MSSGDQPGESERHVIDDALIEHAVRVWDSERENANRLSGRATLLMTALAALFGLGLYKIEWWRGEHDTPRIRPDSAIWVVKSLLGAALLLLAVSFFWLMAAPIKGWIPTIEGRYWRIWLKGFTRLPLHLWDRFQQLNGKPIAARPIFPVGERIDNAQLPAHASEKLNFPPRLFEGDPVTSHEARKMVLSLVYDAALYLQDRNGLRKKRQDQGQQIFLVGLALIGLAILVYIFFSEPPMIR